MKLDAVAEAARELLAMIEEADGREMTSRRAPRYVPVEDDDMEETMEDAPDDGDAVVAVAMPEEAAEEVAEEVASGGELEPEEEPMTPEKRRKLLGF